MIFGGKFRVWLRSFHRGQGPRATPDFIAKQWAEVLAAARELVGAAEMRFGAAEKLACHLGPTAGAFEVGLGHTGVRVRGELRCANTTCISCT